MRNFAIRADDAVWTPVSDPPADGDSVIVTHAGDAFKTETTGRFIDGKWECACAFITNGGATLDFSPTHWRPDAGKSA